MNPKVRKTAMYIANSLKNKKENPNHEAKILLHQQAPEIKAILILVKTQKISQN